MTIDLTRYRDDPVRFVEEVLGDKPYSKQREMLEKVARNRRVSVVGANGSGKDWVAARVILWWLATRMFAKVVVTGPTQRQVEEIVWRELRAAYKASLVPLGGRISGSHWIIDDERFAIGFSTNKADNLQGFHSPELLVIVTEAHAMPQDQMEALKRLNPTRVLLTGNAFSRDGEFFDSHHTKGDLYRQIAISAFDTPNFTGENGGIPGMPTEEDIAERKLDWGVDHPLYQGSVLGRFPDMLDDSLIGRAAIEQAVARWEQEQPSPPAPLPEGEGSQAGAQPSPPAPLPEGEGGQTGAQPSPPAPLPEGEGGQTGAQPSPPAPLPEGEGGQTGAQPSPPAPLPEGEGGQTRAQPARATGQWRGSGECSPPLPLGEAGAPAAGEGWTGGAGEADTPVVPAEAGTSQPTAPPFPATLLTPPVHPHPRIEDAHLLPSREKGSAPVVPAEAGTSRPCADECATAVPSPLPLGEGPGVRVAALTPYDAEPRRLGVDVARFGSDKTALCVRQGWRVESLRSFERVDTMRTVGEAAVLVRERDIPAVFVDEGGLGAGVVDRLRELGAPVHGVQFGGKAPQSGRFANMRAEIFWELRRLFNDGLIAIPRDEELISQLLALRYDVTSAGQVKMESKTSLRKRGVRSPDKADALALAFMEPPSLRIWTGYEPSVVPAEAGRALARPRPPRPVRDSTDFPASDGDAPPPARNFGVWW